MQSGSISGQAREVLLRYASRITVDAALEAGLKRQGKNARDLDREGMTEALATAVVRSLSIYLRTPGQRLACRKDLMGLVGLVGHKVKKAGDGRRNSRAGTGTKAGSGSGSGSGNSTAGVAPVRMTIVVEVDVVRIRRDARALAVSLGFDHASTIKVATAVSEVARNIISYASTGTVELGPVPGRRVGIRVVAEDQGPGIPNLDEILDGDDRPKTGMGFGIRGARNIMDEFKVATEPGRGTRIEMVKYRL